MGFPNISSSFLSCHFSSDTALIIKVDTVIFNLVQVYKKGGPLDLSAHVLIILRSRFWCCWNYRTVCFHFVEEWKLLPSSLELCRCVWWRGTESVKRCVKEVVLSVCHNLRLLNYLQDSYLCKYTK